MNRLEIEDRVELLTKKALHTSRVNNNYIIAALIGLFGILGFLLQALSKTATISVLKTIAGTTFAIVIIIYIGTLIFDALGEKSIEKEFIKRI